MPSELYRTYVRERKASSIWAILRSWPNSTKSGMRDLDPLEATGNTERTIVELDLMVFLSIKFGTCDKADEGKQKHRLWNDWKCCRH